MTVSTKKPLYPALQLLILITLAAIAIFIGYLVGMGLITAFYGVELVLQIARLDLSSPHAGDALWILQVVSTTVPLLLAPVVFSFFIVKEPVEYLRYKVNFPWPLWLIAIAIMLTSSPLIEFLSNINQKLVLPHYLDSVQHWMRTKEDDAKRLIDVLLRMPTFGSMISNVIFVGLFTAVVEEVMFRGCIQTIFHRWTKSAHAAVWITAILFSAFHMEFFGFLPRLLLGALFGYFTVWSGSIWPAIWGHFINNGSAVVVTYLFQNKKTGLNPDDQHIFNYGGYLISLIIVLFLLYLYRNVATAKKAAFIS